MAYTGVGGCACAGVCARAHASAGARAGQYGVGGRPQRGVGALRLTAQRVLKLVLGCNKGVRVG